MATQKGTMSILGTNGSKKLKSSLVQQMTGSCWNFWLLTKWSTCVRMSFLSSTLQTVSPGSYFTPYSFYTLWHAWSTCTWTTFKLRRKIWTKRFKVNLLFGSKHNGKIKFGSKWQKSLRKAELNSMSTVFVLTVYFGLGLVLDKNAI